MIHLNRIKLSKLRVRYTAVAEGRMIGWGLSFRSIGQHPAAVCFSFTPKGKKGEDGTVRLEVEISGVEDAKRIYDTLRDYLERHKAL